jgi:hypothetical protein
MSSETRKRYWSFPRRGFNDISALALLVWLGYTIAVPILSIVLDRRADLDRSVWEEASRAGQWFVLFVGIHLGSVVLPLNISHGKTRRDFAIESTLLTVAYTAIVGLLLTLGWIVERVLYSVLDVSQRLESNHIFGSPTDYPAIFLENWLILLLWMAGGTFIAAAWYRYDAAGLLSIIPALVVASVCDLVIGTSWGPAGNLINRTFDVKNPPVLITVLVVLAGITALMLMAWRVIRDVPMRNQPA